MISKFQMSHLLHFMKKNPSLSKNKVLKGHSYRCLWQSLADWLNYLAQSDKNFLKTTDEWIQFWDELNLSVQRKVFAFIDLEENEKVVLDILCSEVHVPEYLMEEVSAADDDGVVEIPNEYFYHDGSAPLTKEKIYLLKPILQKTYLYSLRIKSFLDIYPLFSLKQVLDLEKFDTEPADSIFEAED